MEKFFKLTENGTTVKTEVVAGLTTFMTMAYIIALNPNLLTGFDVGSPLWNGVFMATCVASAIGTICMALYANKPFAMAPGMGLNSFFAVVVSNIVAITGMTYVESFQSALCIILIEGIIFVILSVLNVREKIVQAIPLGIRLGIAPSIGLMLMNIGFGTNVGVYDETGTPNYVMSGFFAALTPKLLKDSMGASYSTMVLTVITIFIGLFVIIVLAHKGVKAAVILGMLIASVVYWIGEAVFLGSNPFASLATASFVPPVSDMVSTTLFKYNFGGLVQIGDAKADGGSGALGGLGGLKGGLGLGCGFFSSGLGGFVCLLDEGIERVARPLAGSCQIADERLGGRKLVAGHALLGGLSLDKLDGLDGLGLLGLDDAIVLGKICLDARAPVDHDKTSDDDDKEAYPDRPVVFFKPQVGPFGSAIVNNDVFFVCHS